MHQADIPRQKNIRGMCSVMSKASDAAIPHSHDEEEKLIINVTAWQLPPDGEVCCDETATPVISRRRRFGTDECHLFTGEFPSPRECDMVPPIAGETHCPARGRASTWPGCAVQASLLRADSEGAIKTQSPGRAFLSLMLPEWVHEKAAEDEIAGIFPSRSAMSSIVSSPASSLASSPLIPSRAESRTKNARRSGVNWADLSDSEEEDGPVSYTWSTISTATSSPALMSRATADRDCKDVNSVYNAVDIVTLGDNLNAPKALPIGKKYQLASPQKMQASGGPCGQPHVHGKAAGQPAMRWADLVESDVDPVDYMWSDDASVLVDASLVQETCQDMLTEVASAGVYLVEESIGFESNGMEFSKDLQTSNPSVRDRRLVRKGCHNLPCLHRGRAL